MRRQIDLKTVTDKTITLEVEYSNRLEDGRLYEEYEFGIIDENGYDCELECDGGVSEKNIRDICSYGINVVVAGSAVFGRPDIGAAIAALRAETEDF